MKRIIVSGIVALVAAGLLAAPAAAITRPFHGPVEGGGRVSFSVLFRDGQPKRAGSFSFTNIPVKCTGGKTRVSYSTHNSVAVTPGRRFHYDFNFGGGQGASIDGKVGENHTHAHGNTKYGPANPSGGDHTNCVLPRPAKWDASI